MRASMMASNKRAFALSFASIAPFSCIIDNAHAATTYLGDQINYGYGIVQVQITVDDAHIITQIDTPRVSTQGSNASYTHYALPTLVKEALAAQSAQIQGVSGASYLSQGWITSLASAIAKVGNVVSPTPAPTLSVTPSVSATPSPPLNPSPTPSATPSLTAPLTPTPTPVAPAPVLKPGAGVIQKSITCVKGATKKVVKGLNPKCPTGFTLKKP
jgi:uncharacterized protein with FMN-binding domain